MSESIATLQRKISSAGDLQSVVRTMKALAAANIGQYEKAVLTLGDYYRTVELGLAVCFRDSRTLTPPSGLVSPIPLPSEGEVGESEVRGGTGRRGENHKSKNPISVAGIVFGSDQGLVGQFNEVVADFAIEALKKLPGTPEIWAVGERVQAQLSDAGLTPKGVFPVPNSVQAITSLVAQIQLESEASRSQGEYSSVYVFHNRPQPGALYEPVSQRLLPLDAEWQAGLAKIQWPTKNLPEVIGANSTGRATLKAAGSPIPLPSPPADSATLRALVREYLFISLFRACAESLASENASRLSAMQRAEKNIEDLLGTLQSTYHRVRQSGIDEELFDVVSGFEALST